MNDDQQLDAALLERFRRLQVAAQRVLDETEALNGKQRVSVEAHLLRALDREIRGEPQPTFFTMSAS